MQSLLHFLQQLFNSIPGTLLAKLTRLWKTYHLLNGTYRPALRRLHEKHGPIIQVAPNEFSLGSDVSRQCITVDGRFLTSLPPQPTLIKPTALLALQQSLRMDQLFRIERKLQQCNSQLLDSLANAALNGQPVDIPRLLACHAYDVLFCTSIGQRAGFLDPAPNTNQIGQALEDWKFHSLLYGSYLRYHPLLKKVLAHSGYRRRGQLMIEAAATSAVEDQQQDISDSNEEASDSNTTDTADANVQVSAASNPTDDYEARIAMSLAGADPTITLMLKSLHHISTDYTLLLKIRTEIAASKIAQPAKLTDMIEKRLDLPMLFATLHETMRTYPMHDIGLSYVVPKGGVSVNGVHLPESSVVTLESLLAHVNPTYFGTSAWDPTRWLTPVAADLKRLLPAYGIRDIDQTIPECQTLLAAQLLAQLLPFMSIKSDTKGSLVGAEVSFDSTTTDFTNDTARPWADAPSCEASTATSTTPLRLNHMEIFGELLGADGTKILFEEYDPNHTGDYRGKKILRFGPINDGTDRFRLHKAAEQVYAKRVEHRTDPANQVMYFGPGGRLIRFDKPKNDQRVHGGRARNKDQPFVPANTVPSPKIPPVRPASTTAPAAPRRRPVSERKTETQPRNSTWGNWATTEDARIRSFKTAESWALQQEHQKAQAALGGSGTPKVNFKEKFIQRGEKKETEPEAHPPPAAAAARKEGFVPPHLRRKAAAGGDGVEEA